MTFDHGAARVLEFSVRGVPVPQGSMQAFRQGDRAVLVHSGGAKLRNWRAAVSEAAEMVKGTMRLEGPVRVEILFRMPDVASDRFRTRHATRPDVDKLARSILDSLTSSGVIRDDSQVCELHAKKIYARGGWTGCRVVVTDLAIDEAETRDMLKKDAKRSRAGSK
jgi:crossover junction endodeoxyribonuclease RusA